MDIQKFDLPLTFKTFNTIQKLAPIIEKSQGHFSCLLDVQTYLTGKMEPDLNTMTGKGKLTTHKVVIDNSKGVLGKLADQVKMEQFKKVELDNVNISFTMKDGKMDIVPFDFKVGKSDINVTGYSKIDQTILYNLNMSMPTAEMKGASALSAMLGGASGIIPEKMNAKVSITGTVTDPKLSIDMKEMMGNAVSGAKEMLKEEVNKLKDQGIEKAKEEINKVKDDAKQKAQEEAAKIMREAQSKADMVRREAQTLADKIRSEGEAAAKKIEAEAKNPIAKIAAKEVAKKTRDEANKKADQTIREANTKADDILKTGQDQADKLK